MWQGWKRIHHEGCSSGCSQLGKGSPMQSNLLTNWTHSYGCDSPERLSIALSTMTDIIAMVTEALKPWEILVLVTLSATIGLRQCPFYRCFCKATKLLNYSLPSSLNFEARSWKKKKRDVNRLGISSTCRQLCPPLFPPVAPWSTGAVLSRCTWTVLP